ncbi:MAG TPA: alanine dehydrogenase [Polyangiaceae bacterium]|nr:alanine dehydrogenase [Polyangiaceae bacterium]
MLSVVSVAGPRRPPGITCLADPRRVATLTLSQLTPVTAMIVGVPKEIKDHEYRVALLPVGVAELTQAGHQVLVQRGAGEGAGIGDERFRESGARLVDSANDLWGTAELVVKVKEPQTSELSQLRKNQLVFTYFHFAASQSLTHGVQQSGATALAYETLTDETGQLKLLTPMSEIAGRLSVQAGAKHLERPQGGSGVLLGGAAGVQPAQVLILGGGVVGTAAAKNAAGLGANVFVLDNNVERLRTLADILPRNVTALFADRETLSQRLLQADLVIGAVLVRGAKAPRLVSRDDLKTMKPRSVIVDVAVDQGGCVETARPTTHSEPTYLVDDIVHYCVTNMPSAVSRTSTQALCNVTFPYVKQLADQGLVAAVRKNPTLISAVNIHQGKITDRAVAETFSLPYHEFTV